MILSETDIAKYLDQGKIVILPEFDRSDIRPTGVRLHLAEDILVPPPGQTADLGGGSDLRFDQVKIGPDGYRLKPGHFILAATHESFQVSRDVVCSIEGRSTCARVGLIVHCTSSTIDGNYEAPARVTLEMANLGPFDIILRSGVPIALLTFVKVTEPIKSGGGTKYGSQQSAAAPKF
jgi:dCTP deaminase